jgi:hypothetical protein
MAIITAGAILLTIFIGFPDRDISDRLQLAVELLFTKWLVLYAALPIIQFNPYWRIHWLKQG